MTASGTNRAPAEAAVARSEPSEARQLLAGIIRRRRENAGLTQSALALRLNRPQSIVAEIESGRRKVDVFEFIQIAKALDANPISVFEELVAARTEPDG